VNPLFAEAAGTVQGTWVMGLMTAVFLVFFVGWVLWAYNPSRKAYLEEVAKMPFNEGGES
jgi:cbb3-type cytochrome oxidase subunit 3